MNEYPFNEPAENTESTPYAGEEFFEEALFQDIIGMKSITQVSEKTAYNLKDLQDEVYSALFEIFQKTRGITTPSKKPSDEMFNIFELFFKNYYHHFRMAMEKVLQDQSPLKIAYYLGKNSDKLNAMLNQFIQEMMQEI